MRNMPKTGSQRGFTIVELAIVLVVIGILLGVGASLIGPLTKRVKFNESREVVRAAREAVVGYAIANKQLPATLAAAGVRDTDAWGRQLYYSTNMSGVQLCTTSPAFLAAVTDNRRSPAVTLTNSVVVMLLSLGENGTNNTGTGPFTIEQQFTNDYDDIVEFIDISFLREKVCHSLKITTESLPLGAEESVYPASTLEATEGTAPYTWSIASGSLPAGLSLASGTGIISGTPTVSGSYNFEVQVQDSEASPRIAAKRLTVTINPNPPVITTEFLNYGQVGIAYTAIVGAAGGSASYTWCKLSGSYPTGITTMPPNCPSTVAGTPSVTISGSPSASGTYSFTLQVADNRGRTATKNLSIAINP